MSTKDYAFKDLPVIYRTKINGIDVSDIVSNITGLSKQLDISRPTTFQVSDVTIILNDHDNDWNPENATNKFVFENIDQTGQGAIVEIEAGFIDRGGSEQIETIFSGKILNTKASSNINDRTVTIRVSDNSQRLRNENITDFGLDKQLILQQGAGGGPNANYPFAEILTPVSEDSLLADGINGRTRLTSKDVLEVEGALDPTNVKLNEESLESEGGKLSFDPIIGIKAPYRWTKITRVVEEILKHYDIIKNDVQIDEQDFDEDYMSTYGRPNYFIEGESSVSETWRYRGNITDIWYVDDRNIYFLYSSRDKVSKPRIIRWNSITDSWETVYQRPTYAEWWKFAYEGPAMSADGHHVFYIVGTTKSSAIKEHVRGAYDPTEGTNEEPSGTIIDRINVTNISLSTLEYIGSNDPHSLPVSLGMYYHFGFFGGLNPRIGIQPDNRKNLVFTNALYYCYADSTSCGVAKVTGENTSEPVIGIPHDNKYNHLGFDFYIVGNELYFTFTSQGNNRSTWKVIKGRL